METRRQNNRDALAARGYYQAFQAVKASLAEFYPVKIPVRSQEAHITSGMVNFSPPQLQQVLWSHTN